MNARRILSLSVLLAFVVGLLTPPPPASAVTWGACGIITSPGKIARTYEGIRGIRRVYLKCGGPRFSGEPTWGYRHILRFHRGDFEAMAAGTHQSWRDLADLAMATALGDPDVRGPVRDGKRCFSRALKLYDLRTGRLVRTKIFRVVFRSGDAAIITAYPSGRHC